ncbi:uncharacterized protein LOC109830952 [Asparagus officinalis]|uniref:uncharacterized protein LOC109830952 n=1 Tax=Asparagus officinalis TaxID=4686 RepID=UPI00098E2F0F|nr:uncharacterized protein LOC109830952 [Asparagus officinalis]
MPIFKNPTPKSKLTIPKSLLLSISTISIVLLLLFFSSSSSIPTSGYSISSDPAMSSIGIEQKNDETLKWKGKKFLYWGNRIDCPGKHCDSCAGLGHQESSLRCALEEALFLKRVFVMPSRMCINPIHNKKGILHHSTDGSLDEGYFSVGFMARLPLLLVVSLDGNLRITQKNQFLMDTWHKIPNQGFYVLCKLHKQLDPSSCTMDSLYDMDLISETIPVILDNSKTWHRVISTSMKLGKMGVAHVQGFSRVDLKDSNLYSNVLLINRTASPLSWFMECKGRNNHSSVLLPYSFLPSMAAKQLRVAADKIKELLGDYDAIHVRRGDILKTRKDGHGVERTLHPHLDRDTRPEFIQLRISKWIPPGRTLFIASNERSPGFFSPLSARYIFC